MRFCAQSCGVVWKIKKNFLVGSLPKTKSAEGGGGVGVVWVWVSVLILLVFLIPFGYVDYYLYLCTVLKYILIGGGLIRENGVATFHKCTLKVGKM